MFSRNCIQLVCRCGFAGILVAFIVSAACTNQSPIQPKYYHPIVTPKEIEEALLQAEKVTVTCRESEADSVVLSAKEVRRFADAFKGANPIPLAGGSFNVTCWLHAEQDGKEPLLIVLGADKRLFVNSSTIYALSVNPFLFEGSPTAEQFKKAME